ncbi:MAG: sulfotransferase family protein [Alphaproteobacteria bacterium]
MPPAEVKFELSCVVADIAAVPTNNRADVARVQALTNFICHEWRMIWHAHGPTAEGMPQFHQLVERVSPEALSVPKSVIMASNSQPVAAALMSVLAAMVRTPITGDAAGEPVTVAPQPAAGQAARAAAMKSTPRFDRPVFIVSAPRSGSTLLFELLAANDALWTLGDEGHGQIESIPSLSPRNRNLDSNRLTAGDTTPDVRDRLLANYASCLRDATGKPWAVGGATPDSIRFLEKTPKNALRIPFFKAVFPDARFIFLQREAKANISAIIEAWRSGRFVTYRDLTGWMGMPWSMLLIPGWRELNGADLAEIAVRQWRDTNETIMKDLSALPESDWCTVQYEQLLADAPGTLARLCAFAEVPLGERARAAASGPLRPSRYTLTPPEPEKWRKNEGIMKRFLPLAKPTADKLAAMHAARAQTLAAAE